MAETCGTCGRKLTEHAGGLDCYVLSGQHAAASALRDPDQPLFKALKRDRCMPERPERPAWVIRVCRCGCPLGAGVVAMRLRSCPDCGAPVIPVEDRTRRVFVVEEEGMGTEDSWGWPLEGLFLCLGLAILAIVILVGAFGGL